MSSVVNVVKLTLAISEATGLDIFHAVDILLCWLVDNVAVPRLGWWL